MTDGSHWERVYGTKAVDEVSWYQSSASRSLGLIRRAVPDPASAIVDVGGGASVLVDQLVQAGYEHVTVVDLAGSALAAARARLGDAAARVHWIQGDVRTVAFPRAAFDLWHDRAVFHFLVDAADRASYRAQIARALRPGGFVVLATFAEDGPTSCSGLPVRRYSEVELQQELGPEFQRLASEREMHRTPAGGSQSFIYCLFQLAASDPAYARIP